ncbi:hypothetical protein Q5P01_013640 [Channa striata]|uniref:Ig-like domain-containing protein n=1 Tax=Channa striata TaxID=64152 RepID=A0AA88MN47_CHASR|nr:hypothetical protein Q5P01_013640 [Channa striata]
MVTMFRREQAALLSIQLLVMCQVHAEEALDDHRNKHVSSGETITLTCNITDNSPTQIHWSKGNCVFVYSPSNHTLSNFTSKRLKINPDLPTTLHISDAQHEDAGLYTCKVTGRHGVKTIRWNLTVSENRREGIDPLWCFLYVPGPVVGFLLCVFRALDEDPPNQYNSSTLSYVHVHLEGEVVPPEPHSCAVYRMDHKLSKTMRDSLPFMASAELKYKVQIGAEMTAK